MAFSIQKVEVYTWEIGGLVNGSVGTQVLGLKVQHYALLYFCGYVLTPIGKKRTLFYLELS